MITFPKHSANFLQQNISFEQWQQQVAYYRDLFLQTSEQSWLLFTQDSYLFSQLFFALIAANKRIVLPPNGQLLQVKQCMNDVDVFIGELENSDDTLTLNQTVNYFDLTPCFHQSELALTNKQSIKPLEFSPQCPIVFYTSGSSGQAKAIEKSFEQLILEVEQLEKSFANKLDKKTSNTKQAIVMATVSHQHIYGLLFKLLWPIWSGRDLYLKAFAYPEHLAHQIQQYPQRSVCLISSPAYYHRLLADNVLVAVKAQLHCLFSSGGPLNSEAAITLNDELDVTPIEVFGSTETGGIAWRQRQSLKDDSWQVFSGISIQCNENTQQLAVLSPYVDKKNWYQTDDRIELIDKQTFKLLGRADRIVKIEEKRCSLDEIGLRLIEHHWVEQAYVIVVNSKVNRRCLAAVIELTLSGKAALQSQAKFSFDRQLKNHLKQYFEALVIPKKYRYLAKLPYNSQGKLNKKQVESLFD